LNTASASLAAQFKRESDFQKSLRVTIGDFQICIRYAASPAGFSIRAITQLTEAADEKYSSAEGQERETDYSFSLMAAFIFSVPFPSIIKL
jgi:hypothetical protein